MDKAQIQHAIDMVEMYQGQLKEQLIESSDAGIEVEELNERVRELEGEKDDAESDRDDLQDKIDEAIDLLQDLVDRNVTTSDIEAIIKHLQE